MRPERRPLSRDWRRNGRGGRAILRALAHRGGATAVEFAILAPLLLMLLIGMIEVGRLLWTVNALEYAVAEAARCVTIDTSVCDTLGDTQDFAATQSGMRFPSSIFSVSQARCGNRVSATYAFAFFIPIVHPVTLTAESCFPV